MSKEYEETVLAVAEGVRQGMRADGDAPPSPICPITPFAGVDSTGRPVQAVGVLWYDDMMQFACIVTDLDDDSIYPIILATVYPPETKPEDLPPPIIGPADRSLLPAAFRKPIQWPTFQSASLNQGEDHAD